MEEEHEIDSRLSFSQFLGRKNQQEDREIIPRNEFDLYYKIESSRHRRRCLILNYKNFASHKLAERTWSKRDVHLLQSTFEQLKFTVQLWENLSFKSTINLLQTESKKADNKDVDCFVLIILSHQVELHQGKLEFQCSDSSLSVELAIEQLTKPSAALAGKPKLLFIEASNYSMESNLSTLTHDGGGTSQVGNSNFRQYRIPRHADCLVLYLTSSAVVNLSSLEADGSQAIRLLCDTLLKFSNHLDLMTMLTLLADAFQRANEASDRSTSLVQTMSTLTRLVHLGSHRCTHY